MKNNVTQLKQNLANIIISAWRQRWVIAIPTLIFPILAVMASKLAPTTYKSHTSMLIQETAKMNPFLEDIAVSTMLNERLGAIQTLLKSRHVLGMVAQELKLIDETSKESDKEWVIGRIAANLQVKQMGKDLLKIEYQAASPKGMKRLLESVSQHFIEQVLAPERSSMTDSSAFLNQHINQRLTALQLAEEKLANYSNQNIGFTPELQSQNYTRLAMLKQSLAEKQAELSGVERSLGSLDQQLSQTNPVVGRIEEQIVETRSSLTLLQAKYTEKHSAVQAKQRELKRLETEREKLLLAKDPNLNPDKLWDMASSQSISEAYSVQPLLVSQLALLQQERGRYESLKEETKRLAQMITELTEDAYKFGDQIKEVYRLQRDVELKRQLYEELVERFEMAQLTGSLGRFEENKRVKIIDRPYTPSRPSNFPTIVYIIAGIVAGLFLGIGVAIISSLFDSRIRTAKDIMALTDIPVLATITRSKD